MAKGTVKKKVPDAPWENKKVPKAPFENQSYGLVQLSKVIAGIVEQNAEASTKLLEYLKQNENRKIEVNVPEVKIPEIKLPELKAQKAPIVNLPEPNVIVNVPKPDIVVNVPETVVTKGWRFKLKRHPNMLLDEVIATRLDETELPIK